MVNVRNAFNLTYENDSSRPCFPASRVCFSFYPGDQPLRSAAEAPNFAGEYADKKFLNGRAVFQLSLEQSGNTVNIFFAAGYNDGHGTAPEATCTGKVSAKGTVEFKFVDSDGNSGDGTITRAGNDVVVSIKATRVRDKRALEFYRDGMRLTPANKK